MLFKSFFNGSVRASFFKRTMDFCAASSASAWCFGELTTSS
jgi:hypothetical protein